MNLQKIFSFSPFFFSLNRTGQVFPGHSPFPLSVFPTWEHFQGPKAECWPPAGLACPFMGSGYLHRPAQLHVRPHTRVYSSTETLAPQKARGIRLFSTLKVFI